jgi:hypothetical protein
VAVRYQSIDRSLLIELAPELTDTGRSQAFAEFAREEIIKADQHNMDTIGFAPYETFVDGRRTDDLRSVKPNGVIIAEWEFLGDIVREAAKLLAQHSPVGKPDDPRPGHPGLYRRSHILLIDGEEHDLGAEIPPFDRAVLVNTQPYARKIERGLSKQAPDGVYQVIADILNARFKNMAVIRFVYTSLLGTTALEQWALKTSLTGKGRGLRSRTRDEWLRRQPSIMIAPRA